MKEYYNKSTYFFKNVNYSIRPKKLWFVITLIRDYIIIVYYYILTKHPKRHSLLHRIIIMALIIITLRTLIRQKLI